MHIYIYLSICNIVSPLPVSSLVYPKNYLRLALVCSLSHARARAHTHTYIHTHTQHWREAGRLRSPKNPKNPKP